MPSSDLPLTRRCRVAVRGPLTVMWAIGLANVGCSPSTDASPSVTWDATEADSRGRPDRYADPLDVTVEDAAAPIDGTVFDSAQLDAATDVAVDPIAPTDGAMDGPRDGSTDGTKPADAKLDAPIDRAAPPRDGVTDVADSPFDASDRDVREADAAETGSCACDTGACVDGYCCAQPVTSGALQLPAHTAYLQWSFDKAGAELTFDLDIENDPGSSVGLYFAPSFGSVDGTAYYFGMQTNMIQPGVGPVGKGFVFSRWGSQSTDDLRVSAEGFYEVGSHEGLFVGVRRPVAWGVGRYLLSIRRAEASGDGDWFDFSVEHGLDRYWIGGLRFPRAQPSTPATFSANITSFAEVYSSATSISDVPAWSFSVSSTLDNAGPRRIQSEYPAFPTAEFPNVDVSYHAGRARIAYGGLTARCHPPMTLVQR